MKINNQSLLPIICVGAGILSILPYAIWRIMHMLSLDNASFFVPTIVLLGIITLFSGIPLGMFGMSFGVFAIINAIIQKSNDQYIWILLGIALSVLGFASHVWQVGDFMDALRMLN